MGAKGSSLCQKAQKPWDIIVSLAVLGALTEFRAPVSNLSVEELATPGLLYVFGISPLRVDILNRIKGADVNAILKRAQKVKIAGSSIQYCNAEDATDAEKIGFI